LNLQRLFHLNLPKQEHSGGRESADRPNFPVQPRISFCPKILYLLGSGLSGLGMSVTEFEEMVEIMLDVEDLA